MLPYYIGIPDTPVSCPGIEYWESALKLSDDMASIHVATITPMSKDSRNNMEEVKQASKSKMLQVKASVLQEVVNDACKLSAKHQLTRCRFRTSPLECRLAVVDGGYLSQLCRLATDGGG